MRRAKSIKSLHDKCWKLWSKIVRRNSWRPGLSDDYGVCFTCGNVYPQKELQAGHRYHGVLDFDFVNIHAQCIKCNKFMHGNLGEYERRIVEKYGQISADALNARAKQHKPMKLIEEYEALYEYLKDKWRSG